MYILYKTTSSDKLGIIQIIGRVLNYAIGYIPDTHADIADYNFLNPTVLDEGTAMGWKFFALARDYISVRPGTPQNDQLSVAESMEPTGEKVKYYLTDTDKANGAAFMKALMRQILDDVYEKRFTQLNLNVTTLEQGTWAQQRLEAESYQIDNSIATPMLSALAASRNITVAEMADKVIQAVNKYNQDVATLLANKQAVEKEIKECVTIKDCNRLMHNRFDCSMPLTQAQEEGVTTSSQFDL